MSESKATPPQPAIEWFRQALAEAQRDHVLEIEASALIRAELEDVRLDLARKEQQLVVLAAEIERQKTEVEAIHRSVSWRLTRPLRAGKAAPRRLGATLAHAVTRATRQTKQALIGAVRPAVHWVVRRPRLFILLRRTVAAHPRTRDFLKARLISDYGGPARATAATLTADARFVLEDLERALARTHRTTGGELLSLLNQRRSQRGEQTPPISE